MPISTNIIRQFTQQNQTPALHIATLLVRLPWKIKLPSTEYLPYIYVKIYLFTYVASVTKQTYPYPTIDI